MIVCSFDRVSNFCIFQHTTDNSGGFGMDLTSPGSCLEEFRAQPVIECHGHGTCNFYDGITSFWLTIIENGEEFNAPRQQTLKADQTSKISRYVSTLIPFKFNFLMNRSSAGVSFAVERPDSCESCRRDPSGLLPCGVRIPQRFPNRSILLNHPGGE